jgi:probable phosphoglycerate mutase
MRHGKDDDSIRGGWNHSPLTEQGILEIEKIASELTANPNFRIARIFSSDLLRARQTAEIIASKFCVEIECLPQFREVNNGILEGMKNDIAQVRFPGLYWNTLGWDERYPNGESPHQFFDRVSKAWNDFKKQAQQLDGNVLLVTHGGVINVIYHIENGLPYSNTKKSLSIKNGELLLLKL